MPAAAVLVPMLAAAAFMFAKGKKSATTTSDTSSLTSPSNAQLTRAAEVSNTGLAPWVGYSGKNWQQSSVDALASKDPGKIAEVAQNMRLDGLVSQAEELDRYGGTLTAKAAVVNAAIAQTSAIITGKTEQEAYQKAATQPAQPAAKAEKTGVVVPAALNEAARQYATYIRGKRKGAENAASVKDYQKRLGMAADGKFGAGDAAVMAAADVPPPAIWYWPKALAQGPDALARVQAAIALAQSNPQSSASASDWKASYEAQSKSFSSLYGVNAKPRKPTTQDVHNVVSLKMDPALQSAVSDLVGQSVSSSIISGEIGWFGSKIVKKVAKVAKKVTIAPVKFSLKVANPLKTVQLAAKVARHGPKEITKAVSSAAKDAKSAVKQLSKISRSPYVKVAATGAAIICPPIGVPAVAAVAAITAGSAAMSAAEKQSQAAAHMVALAGKTVDALKSGTKKQKAAAEKLIRNTHAAAKTPGPDQKGAMAGLASLAVAAQTRSNAKAIARVATPAPAVKMAGILVSDAGKIVRGEYKAA